jgi:hypothetical protein
MKQFLFRKLKFIAVILLFFLILPLTGCHAQNSDDIYEQNDSFNTAKVLYLGSTTDLYLADDDYYRFYTAVQGELKISVAIVGQQTELNYILKDNQGNNLTEGQFNASNGKKEILTNVGGNAWLYLYFYRGSSSNPSISYTITILFTPTTSSTEDAYEDNDDFSNAKIVYAGDTNPLFLWDADWFKFFPAGAGSFIVNLTYTGSQGALSYDLLTDTQTVIASGQFYSWSISLDILTNVGGNSWLYLHIKSPGTLSASIPYTLHIQFIPGNNNTTSTAGNNSNTSGSNAESPFGKIPGYPIFITGGFMVLTTRCMVALIKKQKNTK